MARINLSNQRLLAFRPAVLGLFRALFLGVSAAPLQILKEGGHHHGDDDEEGAELWVLLIASFILVLLGGAFAGLTIALMGQDGIYLQVLAKDPSESQQKSAKRVLALLDRGKHWVLVTLLLGNVIVNETLPVVLDRCLGGGIAAVVGSTILIVIFGEILPQSICVRYGLPIGGFMSKPVLFLMYLMAPVAWPTAKLLDWALGEDHGTVYKKSGLKTLVSLHHSLGDVTERLNQDEVTIIGAVLELKDKPVRAVMTPMDDVFTMSEETVLDESTMDMILSAGYSRIPIHETNNPTNFIGMLLVKILITYDPEDSMRVRDFALATLPETRPETSCLDIINFFQEGKSHMVLVSESPGDDHGSIGVVTLEDVIEELIGEEIIDESDVFIDVHKAIRRLAPAPKARQQKASSQVVSEAALKEGEEASDGKELQRHDSISAQSDVPGRPKSPKLPSIGMRRSSAGADGRPENGGANAKAKSDALREHLKHLGPSNKATNPKTTRSTTVKIKPGTVIQPRPASPAGDRPADAREPNDGGNETTSLLRPTLTGKDGVHALRQSYGSTTAPPGEDSDPTSEQPPPVLESSSPLHTIEEAAPKAEQQTSKSPDSSSPKQSAANEASAETEVASPIEVSSTPAGRSYVRSGSINEHIVESRGGRRKVVLETTSSSDGEAEDDDQSQTSDSQRPAASRSNLTLPFKLPGSVKEEPEEDDENEENAKADSKDSATADNGASSNGGAKKKNRRKNRKAGSK